jgi:hypothetical protein
MLAAVWRFGCSTLSKGFRCHFNTRFRRDAPLDGREQLSLLGLG